MKTIVLTSGYFNPIHPGHIECFELCKALGDELRVIVNNDLQSVQKTQKSDIFQTQECRCKIVSSLRMVDHVILSVDTDLSVCESIQKAVEDIHHLYGESVKIIFGKGGDRFLANIPEVKVCQELGVEIRDGLGQKIDHSRIYREKSGK